MLSLNNYNLLVYLRDNHKNDESGTVAAFGSSVYARLEHLSKLEAVKPTLSRHDDGSCVHTGYNVTSIGHMLIEDYEHENKVAHKAKFEERAWKFAPVAISLVSLVKSFWPEITTLLQTLQLMP